MDTTVRHTRKISSAPLFITLDGRYDGSSQTQRSVEGLRSITLELLEFGYWTTSLIITTNQQDEPSWLRRSVTHFVTSHLVRLPHLPSVASVRCHLRTITGTTDRHKLRTLYFSAFLSQKHLCSSLARFPSNKEKLT